MKEYVKKGTLFSAKRTWDVRSHMLNVDGNFPGHIKCKNLMEGCQMKEDEEHLVMKTTVWTLTSGISRNWLTSSPG